MSKRDDLRFTPTPGLPPPYLAGRQAEKAWIKMALDHLGAGSKTTDNMALIGPRGNGKTTLLKWVKSQIINHSSNIECVELNFESFKSPDILVKSLRKPGMLSVLADDGFSATIDLLGSEISVLRQGAAKELLRPVLLKRCSRTGLAILIDEAHMLDCYPDVVREFFNEVQMLVGDFRPIMMILAGTPNMSTRLSKIEATYWDRLKKFGVGLLDADVARDALRIPLREMGYDIEGGVLDAASDAAQRYPYFLQVVGDELHKAAKVECDLLGPRNEIGPEILDCALKNFDIRRKNYYAERYLELQKERILTAAEAVAECFTSQNENSIYSDEVELAIRQSYIAGAESAMAAGKDDIDSAVWEAEVKLRHVGIIWSQIGQEEFCEPGIPSLMDYILYRAHRREQVLRRKIDSTPKTGSEIEEGIDGTLPA